MAKKEKGKNSKILVIGGVAAVLIIGIILAVQFDLLGSSPAAGQAVGTGTVCTPTNDISTNRFWWATLEPALISSCSQIPGGFGVIFNVNNADGINLLDGCSDDGTKVEDYSCQGGGVIKTCTSSCPSGKICSAGACISQTSTLKEIKVHSHTTGDGISPVCIPVPDGNILYGRDGEIYGDGCYLAGTPTSYPMGVTVVPKDFGDIYGDTFGFDARIDWSCANSKTARTEIYRCLYGCDGKDCRAAPVAPPTPTCSSGKSSCRDGCVNLKIDTQNCGSCGKVCKVGEVCSKGGCSKPAGR